MRNRKESVGAKAAAWVGITLGAVVFFTGAAGVLLMDQAGEMCIRDRSAPASSVPGVQAAANLRLLRRPYPAVNVLS